MNESVNEKKYGEPDPDCPDCGGSGYGECIYWPSGTPDMGICHCVYLGNDDKNTSVWGLWKWGEG